MPDRRWHRNALPHRTLRQTFRGSDVRQFQQGLNARLTHITGGEALKLRVDGDFGDATLAAWRKVRWSLGLPAEHPPTIGAQLNVRRPWTRTRRARKRAKLRRKADHGGARQRVVARARSFIGTTENPAGSNSGGIITTWCRNLGFGAVPWCGIFCGNMLRDVGVDGVTSRIAGVALIEEDAQARAGCYLGWTTDSSKVRPGDLVVLFGYGVHVEMVERVAGGVIYTVGGNTSAGSSGSQSNGGGVFSRARSRSDVRGFALVDFPS